MEKRRNSQTIIIAVLAVAILFMSVGFALFSQTLNINGTAQVEAAKWDIHWKEGSLTKASDSVDILSGATTGTGDQKTMTTGTTPTLTNTDITFGAILEKPGDKAEFTVQAINDGTFDAKLTGITMSPLTAEQQKYLTYEITYAGTKYTQSATGLNIDLPAKESNTVTVTVAVKYVQPDAAADLPATRQFVSLSASFDYSQKQ